MTELKVIDGSKKDKPNYSELYANAFINTLQSEKDGMGGLGEVSLGARKKVVLYGMKNINVTNLEILDYELWLTHSI